MASDAASSAQLPTSGLLRLPNEIQLRIVSFLVDPWRLRTIPDGLSGWDLPIPWRVPVMQFLCCHHHNTTALRLACKQLHRIVTAREKFHDGRKVTLDDFNGTIRTDELVKLILEKADQHELYDNLAPVVFELYANHRGESDGVKGKSPLMKMSATELVASVHTLDIEVPTKEIDFPTALDFATLPALRKLYVRTWSLWSSTGQSTTRPCRMTADECAQRLSSSGELRNWAHLLSKFVELSKAYKVFNVHTITHNHGPTSRNETSDEIHQLNHVLLLVSQWHPPPPRPPSPALVTILDPNNNSQTDLLPIKPTMLHQQCIAKKKRIPHAYRNAISLHASLPTSVSPDQQRMINGIIEQVTA